MIVIELSIYSIEQQYTWYTESGVCLYYSIYRQKELNHSLHFFFPGRGDFSFFFPPSMFVLLFTRDHSK